MPAACSFSGRLSTRKASTTMSCVAEAVATSSAPSATRPGAAAGLQRAEKHDRRHQQDLREHQPAAAAAEQPRQHRHVERVGQRRPEEFQRVGRADQREQADGAEIDAGLRASTPAASRRTAPAAGPEEKPRNMTISTRGLRVDRQRVGNHDGCVAARRAKLSWRYSPAAELARRDAGRMICALGGSSPNSTSSNPSRRGSRSCRPRSRSA